MTTWVYNDGGRAEAGYKGTARDCSVRAIAIVLDIAYKVIYEDLREFLSSRGEPSPRNGIDDEYLNRYLKNLGFHYTKAAANVSLHRDELPLGRVIATTRNHVVAVIDGIFHDNWNPNAKTTQTLEGYWVKSS
jgi:hypothetical protein